MVSLNPFHNLIETNKYPHARSHRTTFLRKMNDTFRVFWGGEISDNAKGHLGIFDILTLGLHHLVNRPLFFSITSDSVPTALGFLGLLLLILWNIPRFLFAAVLTLVSTPFVWIAQKLSDIEGEPIRSDLISFSNPQYPVYLDCRLPHADFLKGYKNNFFLLDNDQLYLIDSEGRPQLINITAEDIKEIRKEWKVQNELRAELGIVKNYDFERILVYIEREKLDKLLQPRHSNLPNGWVLGKGDSDLGLEGLEISVVSNPKNSQKLFLSIREEDDYKSQPKLLSLDLSKQRNQRFFKQLRQLNVGHIEEKIEHNKELQAKFEAF